VIIHQCAFGNAGHVKLNLCQHLGVLPDSPITSVSGPGITMLLVTPLMPLRKKGVALP